VTLVFLRAIAAALAALSLTGQGPALVPLDAGMVIDRSVTIRPGIYRLSASPDHRRPAVTIRGENPQVLNSQIMSFHLLILS